jgi:hypothetical protein
VKTALIYIMAIAVWFVYFQFIDWLFMDIQGLPYFSYLSSVFQ